MKKNKIEIEINEKFIPPQRLKDEIVTKIYKIFENDKKEDWEKLNKLLDNYKDF